MSTVITRTVCTWKRGFLLRYSTRYWIYLLWSAGIFLSCQGDDEEEIAGMSLAELNTSLRENIGTENRLEALSFKANSSQTTAAIATKEDISAALLERYPNNNYEDVNYLGAVDPSSTIPWYAQDNWSFYSHIVRGVSDKRRPQGSTIVVITEGAMRRAMQANNQHVTWTSANTYVLSGLVFVNGGETLTIEPGTVIKGRDVPPPGSSLIIARRGKIIAEGTSNAPIIFTFEADLLDGTTSPTERGRWGGLVVLGRAELNSTPGETFIEGVPKTEPRGAYGGLDHPDDADNSGVLRYLSIRHGGSEVVPGDEINGITLGAVGTGTVMEYIEVVGNKDDGIEWCGGTVASKHLITAYCADDGLDYNEGYRGFSQFIILHQDPMAGQNGGEHDGGLRPVVGEPYALPLFVNMTSRGSGARTGTNPFSQVMTLRANSGGYFYHSLFIDYPRGVSVEYVPVSTENSWKRVQEGELSFVDNVFYKIGELREDSKVFFVNVRE